MPNNFNFNDNKSVLDGEVISQSTDRFNYPNDASTLEHGFVPYGSYTATTFTVTFNNSDNSGGTATYTAKPFETVGNAIYEKQLKVTNYYPTYRFNESIVTEDTIIPIKADIEINVTWTKISD